MSWKKNNPACPCCGCPEPHLCVAVDWLDNCRPPGTNGQGGGGGIGWPTVTSIEVRRHSDGSLLDSCTPDNDPFTRWGPGCCFDVSAYLGELLDITVAVEDRRAHHGGPSAYCSGSYATSVTPTGTPCTLQVPVHTCAHGMTLNVGGCTGPVGVGFTNQNVLHVEINGCDDVSGDFPTGTPTSLGVNVDAGCCTDETSWTYTITPTCRGFAGPVTVGPVCLACSGKFEAAPRLACAPGYFCSCGTVCWPETLFYSDSDGFSGTLSHGSVFGGGWSGSISGPGKVIDPYSGLCGDGGTVEGTVTAGCVAQADGTILFEIHRVLPGTFCPGYGDSCLHPWDSGSSAPNFFIHNSGSAAVSDVCAINVTVPLAGDDALNVDVPCDHDASAVISE
jgi:hypothetical protein